MHFNFFATNYYTYSSVVLLLTRVFNRPLIARGRSQQRFYNSNFRKRVRLKFQTFTDTQNEPISE